MTKDQIDIIIFLIVGSAVLFFFSVAWYIGRIIKNKRMPEKCNKAGVSTALAFSAILILSIWMLRFAVGYYSILVPKPDSVPLDTWEEGINSFFRALRTFGMEEDYAEYVIDIRALISAIVPKDHWSLSIIQVVAVVYASLLNLIAPIISGAIILEILASVFPKVRLLWSYYVNIRRPKYFFSELNAASLSLAKSIYYEKKSKKVDGTKKAKKVKKPVLIFTDTYVDDEKEKEYELLLEAKKYGAICVRDDLVHVAKPGLGKCEYYLMDENEFGNLQTLMRLIDDHNIELIKDSYIYLFVQSDAYVQIEKQVKLKLEKIEWLRASERPTIVPVRGYRNLVHNLLVDVPLYEPLVHKSDPTSLSVTILGNGLIGTEAFLSVYWFGQMMISQNKGKTPEMTECDLTINVVSKDEEADFWSKIDYYNPEIRKTVRVLGNDPSAPSYKLLTFDKKEKPNKPYCQVEYIKSDLKIGGFWDGECEKAKNLFDSDYFIVALGNDSDNISIAEKLKCAIGKKHIENDTVDSDLKTVIAYAVFDSELAAALNEQKHFRSRKKGNVDIYMHAFGSLDQVYSCDNVYMSKSLLWATETGNAYLDAQDNGSHYRDTQSRTGKQIEDYDNANYNYWASLARSMHVKYKVFSLGWIKTSVFDYSSEKECEDHRNDVKNQCGLYRSLSVSHKLRLKDKNDIAKYNDLELKKHCLAWLEHRRWCAFTRTMGYQYVDIDKILKQNESHKDMRLKLHACLIEARKPDLNKDNSYMSAVLDENAQADRETKRKVVAPQRLDSLDMVSYAKHAIDAESGDFKKNDYYRYEFDEFILEKDLFDELRKLRIPKLEKYSDHNNYEDSVCCSTDDGNVYLISVEAVKWALEKKYKAIPEGENIKCAFEFHGTKYATKFYEIVASIKYYFEKRKKKKLSAKKSKQ